MSVATRAAAWSASRSAFSPLSRIPDLGLRAGVGMYQERTGASATTPAAADADPVGTWLDQSGNGRHVVAATDAKRPSRKDGIQNGLPIARFDGSDDYLEHNAYARTAPRTLYVVFKQRAWTSNSGIVDCRSDAQRFLLEQNANSGDVRPYSGIQVTNELAMGTAAFGIVCAVFNGASSRWRLNAGAAETGNIGSDAGNGIVIGALGGGLLGTFPAAIDVCELWDYPGAHSVDDETLMRDYLNAYWTVF